LLRGAGPPSIVVRVDNSDLDNVISDFPVNRCPDQRSALVGRQFRAGVGATGPLLSHLLDGGGLLGSGRGVSRRAVDVGGGGSRVVEGDF